MRTGFFNLLRLDHRREMMRDVRTGLTRPRKSIPAKYFYDSHGSWLFEQITTTPEYYLTKTELSILDHSAHDMVKFLSGEACDIVELGSGSAGKIRKLLDAAYANGAGRVRYVPVDICGRCVEEVMDELPPVYPGLEVLGLNADFTSDLRIIQGERKLVVFFGSTIGNFTESECTSFLERIKLIMNPEDRLLVGMDMVKPVHVMEAAYNDKAGNTRRFNLNMLSVLNRELGADFNPDDFEHLARYNPDEEQIEMHLRARRAVSASIPDLSLEVTLHEGETIHTEICRKFTRDRIQRLFALSGFSIEGWFSDPRGWFSLVQAGHDSRISQGSSRVEAH